MNVVFITHYTALYGANRSLLNLLDGLKLFDVNPIVVTRGEGEITTELKKRSIKSIASNFDYDFINPNEFKGLSGFRKRLYILRKNRFAAKKLVKVLENEKVDLVYTNSSVILIGYFLSRFLNRPHIWHIREFAELHYNLVPNVGYSIFKYLLQKNKATIFVSNCLQQYYEQNNKINSHVVYNGVSSTLFLSQLKRKYHVESNFVFCLVGLIDRNKGQIDAIKAIELLNKKYNFLKLVLAGGGDRTELENYVTKRKIPNILFLGEVEDPYSVYLTSEACLMCSRNEAMGRVTVEAMFSKIPVIGLNNAGTKELITHEVTGLLYNGSIEDLADKMEMLIQKRSLRENLVANAYQYALSNFTQEIYASQVYKIVKSAVSK